MDGGHCFAVQYRALPVHSSGAHRRSLLATDLVRLGVGDLRGVQDTVVTYRRWLEGHLSMRLLALSASRVEPRAPPQRRGACQSGNL